MGYLNEFALFRFSRNHHRARIASFFQRCGIIQPQAGLLFGWTMTFLAVLHQNRTDAVLKKRFLGRGLATRQSNNQGGQQHDWNTVPVQALDGLCHLNRRQLLLLHSPPER